MLTGPFFFSRLLFELDLPCKGSIGVTTSLRDLHMAKKRKKPASDLEAGSVTAHLYEMEPELRMLEGVVAALQALGTTADTVEPIALAALAYLGQVSLEKILTTWRSALLAQQSQQTRLQQK